MTTTAGSPKFLEHADDGTRILNKRRQLFDIKVRCLSLSSYFTRLLAPSITKESHITFIYIYIILSKQERYIAEKAEYDKKCMILEQREADLKRRDLEFQTKLVQYEALSKEKKIKQQKLTQRLDRRGRKKMSEIGQ